MDNNEEIVRKKIVGLRVIAILSIVLYSLVLLSGIFTSFDEAYYYGAGSGLGVFFVYLIFFSGFIALSIIGLIGFNAKRSYAIPVNRAVLILFSFWIGIIPIGLILLIIFWSRLKDNDVKAYLNYPEFSYSSQTKKNNYLDSKVLQDEKQKNYKYCYFCGEKIPDEAIFCKKCGKKQNKDL